MHLDYVILRLGRHFLPKWAVRFLAQRGWLIKPGLETAQAEAAVSLYAKALSRYGLSWEGKRVMLFGYGGNFAVGVSLLEQGAAHVVLCDKFASPDHARNTHLLPRYKEYLFNEEGRIQPNPEFLTVLQEDIRSVDLRRWLKPVDLVLSISVYEHLDDVEGITKALAALTKPTGAHLHFVDLRDHYFKYPFEMLTFSERTWLRWLNPTSHHNRYRIWDYQRVFESLFESVKITVLGRDKDAFEKARPRIRPEFLSGDDALDTVTEIEIFATFPRR